MINFETDNLLKSLRHSIDLLVKAIDQAGETLSQKPNISLNSIRRLQQYKDITNKQKTIVNEMYNLIERKEYSKVYMEVQRVNALSAFIRDDAVDLISEMSGNPNKLNRPEGH